MSVQSYGLVGIGAGLIGVLIGSSGGPDVETLHTDVMARLGDVEAKLDATGDVQDKIDDLGARLTEITSGTAALSAQVSDLSAASDPAVAGMAEQLAALGAAVQGQGSTLGTFAADLSSLKDSVAAMPETLSAQMATPSPAAIAASTNAAPAEAPVAAKASQADAVGDGAIAFSVGQTQEIGTAKLFLSRIDDAAGEAHFRIIGGGAAVVGAYTGPASVHDCTVSLAGIEGGEVYVLPVCP